MDKLSLLDRDQRISVIEWGLVLIGLLALTITEQFQWYVGAGIGLLVAAFILRAWRKKHLLPKTGLELPACLFLFSAVIAAWISYDGSTAWLQAARIAAAMILFYAVVDSDEKTRRYIVAVFILLVTTLALYWPLQHDFSGAQSKFAFIDRVGTWLTNQLPAIPGPSIHANVAAGTLLIGIPFCIAAVLQAWQNRQWIALGLSSTSTILVGGSLLLTSSRGAWVGLGGVIGLAILVVIGRQVLNSNRKRLVFGLAFISILTAGVLVLITSGSLDQLMGQLPDPTGSLQSRLSLWGQGFNLIKDYVYTGSGLMSFRMVYALYGILIHVPHHDHLHNTYLEVWLEQGWLGAIGLILGLLVVGGWVWRVYGNKRLGLWGWAGLAAIGAASIHGIFDVVFYVTRTLPLIGLITGFAFTISENTQNTSNQESNKTKKLVYLGAAVLVAVLGIIFHRSLMASAYANLGAVFQTREELTIYEPKRFDNPTLDMVRCRVDLTPAESAFNRALGWNPQQVTALRRLSMIALSQGRYDQALTWMQQSWDGSQQDEATRLVYGDALSAANQPELAASVLQGIGWADDRLAFQAWYRYWLGIPPNNADYVRSASAWKTVLILDPNYPGAEESLILAEQHIHP